MLSKTAVKYIQSLTHKKFRDEYGLFIAEGPKVVGELISEKRFKYKTICGLSAWLKENEAILDLGSDENIVEVSEIELEKISQLSTPNKVVGVFYKKKAKEMPDLKGKVTLMLDDIQDPGNMGTIIRIADWFGIENIVCSENCVEQYNPKVVQGSMGSIGRVNVVYHDLAAILRANSSIRILAASLDGEDITRMEKKSEAIIIIGNEGKGISEDIMELTNERITIPRYGKAESLNAAVATGIILSHIK
jgi:RNA methyltransferase, TrmH family